MPTRTILSTWAFLVILSLAGTALSLAAPAHVAPLAADLGILAIAWAKARLILLYYLDLARAPRWRGGAITTISCATLLFAGLFVLG